MGSKRIPYLAITEAIASCGHLILLKDAAKAEECSGETLKSNAKSGKLRAYQQHHGAPVFVLDFDVAAFLKSRPDIVSKHHPKLPLGMVGNFVPPPLLNVGGDNVGHKTGPPPPPLSSTAAGMHLASLEGATPDQLRWLGSVLGEIGARVIHSALPSAPPPTPNNQQ